MHACTNWADKLWPQQTNHACMHAWPFFSLNNQPTLSGKHFLLHTTSWASSQYPGPKVLFGVDNYKNKIPSFFVTKLLPLDCTHTTHTATAAFFLPYSLVPEVLTIGNEQKSKQAYSIHSMVLLFIPKPSCRYCTIHSLQYNYTPILYACHILFLLCT